LAKIAPHVNLTACQILEVSYNLPSAPCDQCQQPASRFTTAGRTAIDLDLNQPVLLHVTISVHYCPGCDHYFRAQPPFLRRNAVYTNRVVEKAVRSVYEDGMAMRRVPDRLGRDFWARPSEGSIRQWCKDYRAGFDFEGDYQPWVVSTFSGILCVDEVYQDRLALLLAADPAAPSGDRLVGFQLIHGSVSADDVEQFLTHLQSIGIEPDEVITDGSSLYPTALVQVWPNAAHQLCLFHETRRVTNAAMKAINAIRKSLPHPPPVPGTRGGGPLRNRPPNDDSTDPATQRWYWRRLQRRAKITRVHELSKQGLSQRAIARQTGHNRKTVKRWLAQPIPPLPENMPEEISTVVSLPVTTQRQIKKQQMMRQIHTLRENGLSYSAIGREVGFHRVTVKKWLQQEPLSNEAEEVVVPETAVELASPPAPWSSWEEVRQVREALREHRFLFMRRPENLDAEDQQQIALLLASPVSTELAVARYFLVDWYRLWTKANGQRRSLAEARKRYESWRTRADYGTVSHLRHIQERMTEAKFERLSQFLRHPEWEATNNGAERAGRAFRHRQAPHFNLRSKEAIEGALVVAACKKKEAATQTSIWGANRCLRGRKRRKTVALDGTYYLSLPALESVHNLEQAELVA
jgi:lambda repressor-like predicted transcriptional regulator